MKMRCFCLLLCIVLSCLGARASISFSYPILGGELSNSAATSVDDIGEVMPRMASLGLNTVLVPAYWELMEPIEGQFDFTLIDCTIDRARENGLKVIFLWFGVWKNSMSCYTPAWFKRDVKRFPRSRTASGKPLEIACAFSDNVLQADQKAFTALMQHLAQKDKNTGTVIMVQIENEIGMLEAARDHSPLAEKAWKSPIPSAVLPLVSQSSKLTPHASWADVFGDDDYGEEKFMAYYYACYVERLAKAARDIYDIPLYVNAAMNSRGRKPGEYPSAGPLAHLVDFWKVGAPSIDLLAPDIYDTGFKAWAAQYAMPQRPQDGGEMKNRLFIPETRCSENCGVRALYAFGEHQALGFSPFAIDQASASETESVTKAYTLLRQLVRLHTSKSEGISQRGKAVQPLPWRGVGVGSWGLLFDRADRERIIVDADDVVITGRHYFTLPWDPRATDGSAWPEGGAILLRLNKYEYLLAGSGVVVDFKTKSEKAQEDLKQLGEDGFVDAGGHASSANNQPLNFKGQRLGLLSVDEVTIDEMGNFCYLRRNNGDQSHQGRHARIGVGEWKMLHIKLYQYE